MVIVTEGTTQLPGTDACRGLCMVTEAARQFSLSVGLSVLSWKSRGVVKGKVYYK